MSVEQMRDTSRGATGNKAPSRVNRSVDATVSEIVTAVMEKLNIGQEAGVRRHPRALAPRTTFVARKRAEPCVRRPPSLYCAKMAVRH